MKKILFMLMLLASTFVFAQDSTIIVDSLVNPEIKEVTDEVFPDDTTTAAELEDWYEYILGALVMLLGFLGRAFPILQKVPQYVLVVIAAGVVSGVAFVSLGFGTAFNAVTGFLIGSGVYATLKPFLQDIPIIGILFGGGKKKVTDNQDS